MITDKPLSHLFYDLAFATALKSLGFSDLAKRIERGEISLSQYSDDARLLEIEWETPENILKTLKL